ncbi:MAG: spondin domain-containing protein [Gemmatimonadaceae bacterium]
MRSATRWRLIMASASALAVGVGSAGCNRDTEEKSQTDSAAQVGADTAEYVVVLKSTWTKTNHPYEYPAAGARTGPHFSGLIGASHNASYSLFAEGTPPTPGLERLSEEGKHSPLDDEIRAALAAGNAGMLFESSPLRDFGDSITTTVRVDAAHPMVSLVAMIAPSPDWFTGVSNVNLLVNGAWMPGVTLLVLNAYDSGGDDGTTYKSNDRDANPKKPTSKALTRHFAANGQNVPVATLTLTKQ